MVGIYKITSPTNKIYIGQSWDIKNRWKGYKYTKQNKSINKLQSSFIKYGLKNHIFEIIHELPYDITQNILDNYEILYIQLYKNCGFTLLNIRDGGSKGKLSQETKNKLKNINTGKNNYFWGKKRPDHSKNISGSKNPRAKSVIQLDKNNNFIAEYTTAKLASDITGTPRSSICRSCKYDKLLQSGFKWKYKN